MRLIFAVKGLICNARYSVHLTYCFNNLIILAALGPTIGGVNLAFILLNPSRLEIAAHLLDISIIRRIGIRTSTINMKYNG
jgi:hypothetical protein